MIAFGTISIIVLRTILKYEVISSSSTEVSTMVFVDSNINVLMTSTSWDSFSESVPEAFRVGGGASMAAIFFLFFVAKKLPKNPELPSSRLWVVCCGVAPAGSGFPVFGSTWVGLF